MDLWLAFPPTGNRPGMIHSRRQRRSPIRTSAPGLRGRSLEEPHNENRYYCCDSSGCCCCGSPRAGCYRCCSNCPRAAPCLASPHSHPTDLAWLHLNYTALCLAYVSSRPTGGPIHLPDARRVHTVRCSCTPNHGSGGYRGVFLPTGGPPVECYSVWCCGSATASRIRS